MGEGDSVGGAEGSMFIARQRKCCLTILLLQTSNAYIARILTKFELIRQTNAQKPL